MTLRLELPAPPDSPFRRFDPRWKLAAVALCVAILVPLHALEPLGAALLSTLVLVWFARLPAGWYLRRVLVVVPFLAGLCLFLPLALHGGGSWQVGGLRVSERGVFAALRVSAKCVAMLNLLLVLTATTPPGLLPKAAAALRVPGFLIQLTAVTHRYAHLVVQEFGRLRTALRARGYRGGTSLHTYRVAGRVLGTLLVRSAERAERVGQAMRARGFDGSYRALSAFRTTGADVIMFVVMTGGTAGMLVWQWLLG